MLTIGRKHGFFYLLQLNKLDISKIDISMVMEIAYLWNQNTCALELPYGLVSPTIFDVEVITRLMCTGEKCMEGAFENDIDPKIINWEKKPYGGFMENH